MAPWFEDGLRFECTRCGKCCGGEPGFVWVDQEEISRLAQRLGLSEAQFRSRYTRRVRSHGTSLTETEDYDCIFFDRETGCTVYEDRPRQCRTYPFWGKVLASRFTWEYERRICEGIEQGRSWDLVEIQRLSDRDGLPEDS